MLNNEQLDLIADVIRPLYQSLEQDVIYDIARRIKKTLTYTRTAELMVMEMEKLGYSPAKIRSEAMKVLRADKEFQKVVEENTLEYKKEVKAEAEKIAKKFLEESYYYKSIEDFSYFGDCFTNSSYGLLHYTNYYVIYKAKDKRYGDVYLPIAYENLKLLSDGSIVAEEYPYVKTEFLKELFGNIDDMCDSITNGSSVVSGEFSNYFK